MDRSTDRWPRSGSGVLASSGPARGEGPEPRRFEFTEPHMGTAFTIVLYTDDEATASRASRAAFDRISRSTGP